MYNVDVVGMVHFNCSAGKRMGWAPNGTKSWNNIAPHHAGFFVEPERCAGSRWWDSQTFEHKLKVLDDEGRFVEKSLLEFRIPEPVDIHFPVLRGDVPDLQNLDSGLPRLGQIDPNFEFDEDHADTIARLAVEGGKLRAYGFEQCPVVQWTFDNDDKTFTIEAKANGQTRTITLNGSDGPLGTEVVFANTEELIDPPKDGPDGRHFGLYAKLSKSRNPAGLTPPSALSPLLQRLPSNHTFLRFLSANTNHTPNADCGPTGP